jgi:hypothetical protein
VVVAVAVAAASTSTSAATSGGWALVRSGPSEGGRSAPALAPRPPPKAAAPTTTATMRATATATAAAPAWRRWPAAPPAAGSWLTSQDPRRPRCWVRAALSSRDWVSGPAPGRAPGGRETPAATLRRLRRRTMSYPRPRHLRAAWGEGTAARGAALLVEDAAAAAGAVAGAGAAAAAAAAASVAASRAAGGGATSPRTRTTPAQLPYLEVPSPCAAARGRSLPCCRRRLRRLRDRDPAPSAPSC